jgi:acetyl-CoA acetyltransferase
LLDCCLISDGAVCVIVTSPERARDTRKRPVAIWGMGQGHTTENLRLREWWYLPHQRDCVADAYRMAGVSPRDIDVAQLYDNFTVAVLFWLEHAGFCREGEAGGFVEGGTRITLGGELPINTAGGNLSESYMQGWLHIVEGVRQLRGECGERQVQGAELCLVTGRGMTLNTASCLILGH